MTDDSLPNTTMIHFWRLNLLCLWLFLLGLGPMIQEPIKLSSLWRMLQVVNTDRHLVTIQRLWAYFCSNLHTHCQVRSWEDEQMSHYHFYQ
jgi:hypothetical protein